jgi:hypothetical protein
MACGSSCLARTQGSGQCFARPDPEDTARRGETPARRRPLACSEAGFDAFVAAHPQLLRRDLLLGHYSRERLFSPTARARFVEPDLLALP